MNKQNKTRMNVIRLTDEQVARICEELCQRLSEQGYDISNGSEYYIRKASELAKIIESVITQASKGRK
jgi:predicted DNA-binding protein